MLTGLSLVHLLFSDAIYFSIISLTKVGFGDYVPRTHPPDRYADYIHDNHKCLKGSTVTKIPILTRLKQSHYWTQ